MAMRVRIKDLTKIYSVKRAPLIALEGLCLDVRDGEFLSVVGPNGCGKTTLLRLIAGLDVATAGTINFLGVRRCESLVSMVWQSSALLPWRRVDGNIALPPEIKEKPWPVLKRITNRFLHLAGLKEFQGLYPYQLSGGMKQKTDLARALANDPEVILMDEPFANLDALTRCLLRQELLTLWEQDKKTVIFVTHDLEEAIFLADRVAMMTASPGRIREVMSLALPRPRTMMTLGHPHFVAAVKHIWSLLEKDVAQGPSPPEVAQAKTI